MAKHIVKKGETLSGIASKYKTTALKIKQANSIIKDVNKISVGWVLDIPTGSKNYEAIGKQFEICLNDIKKLASYKKLISML